MTLTKNQTLAIILTVLLLLVLPLAIILTQKRQDIRPKAAGTSVTLGIYPSTDNFAVGEVKLFELKATFTDGSAGEKLDYFKTELTFDKNYFKLPTDKYIDTSASGFDKIFRVDRPAAANDSGKIVIELAAGTPGSGPSTDKPITIAKIYFQGAANTSTSQNVKIGDSQVVNNQSSSVSIISAQGFSYTVGPQNNGTPTPTPTPITTPSTCMSLPQSDTFDTGPNPGLLWNNWVNNGVVTVGGTLNGNVPSGNGFAGLITKNKVCGDFDVKVDFSGFASSGQSEADARLSIEDQSTNSSIFIEKFSKGSAQGFSIKKVTNGQPTIATDVTSYVTSGKMRIRRVGAVYSLYYDSGNGWQSAGSFNSGFTADAQIAILVKSFDQNPSVSASFDNFSLTEAVLDPSITPIPPTPTLIPSPAPLSGREKYTIDIGDKQSLVFQIGPAINPQIKFKAKLASLANFPDLYLRLRVKDELAFMNKQNYQNTSTDTCNEPNLPDRDFYVPMKATGGVYAPVAQISTPAPTGATVATVTPDGWVILEGIVPGRYYTLYLKGPKTRKSKMIEHFLLQPNQTQTQDFDWTGKPLDPGDLPNPDKDMKQDCTINSTDWSLIKRYIGSNKTDAKALDVADVNYDGLVNALDSINILSTLAKRPDDDQ